MSFFNDGQIKGMGTGKYPCPKCKTLMEWEDENEEVLICPKCGREESAGHYGYTDEEYESLYPAKEEVSGYDEEGEEDEYNGETYEEVCGELSEQ